MLLELRAPDAANRYKVEEALCILLDFVAWVDVQTGLALESG